MLRPATSAALTTSMLACIVVLLLAMRHG